MDKVKVVITGNAGFIGSHMADYMIERGYEVHGIDNLSTGRVENINEKVIFHKLDLCHRQLVEDLITDIEPTFIFHFAALARIQPSIEDPVKWNNHNADATLNLLEACRLAGSVKKFIFSSSSSIYGNNKLPFKENQEPRAKHPYGLSKLHGEQWCKLYSDLYGLDTAVLRYFNVYGKRQVLTGDYATVVGIFMHQADTGQMLTIVGDGTQKRDMTYVSDVVRANFCATQRKGFGIYNVGTGKNYKIKDIATMIQPDESQHKYGMVRRAEAKATKANIHKAARELHWKARYSLEEGIADMKDNQNDSSRTV